MDTTGSQVRLQLLQLSANCLSCLFEVAAISSAVGAELFDLLVQRFDSPGGRVAASVTSSLGI